jgi:hypothetical protein
MEGRKMTLDEAISHCMEKASNCQIKACARDHLQLAEWLEELKAFRLNSVKKLG